MTEDDSFRSVILSISSQELDNIKADIQKMGGEIDNVGHQQTDQNTNIFLDITYKY